VSRSEVFRRDFHNRAGRKRSAPMPGNQAKVIGNGERGDAHVVLGEVRALEPQQVRDSPAQLKLPHRTSEHRNPLGLCGFQHVGGGFSLSG